MRSIISRNRMSGKSSPAARCQSPTQSPTLAWSMRACGWTVKTPRNWMLYRILTNRLIKVNRRFWGRFKSRRKRKRRLLGWRRRLSWPSFRDTMSATWSPRSVTPKMWSRRSPLWKNLRKIILIFRTWFHSLWLRKRKSKVRRASEVVRTASSKCAQMW